MRTASAEFSGHCLALTLLGSYLNDAYDGDIRCRSEVTGRLTHNVRQGVHARKVMESYQTWLGEGPELSVLRMLGLFDRPADEKALEALLNPPTIQNLTDSLAGLSRTEWRPILGRLRRARLLAPEDQRNPGYLDAHPLVREYFGEQLRNGVIIDLSLWLAMKAEALHLAGLTFKALETLTEAEEVIQRSGERYWSAELHRLRGVFLAAIGSDQNQIEASFRAAVKTAQEQKSFSLVRRAKGSYAEWRACKEQPRML